MTLPCMDEQMLLFYGAFLSDSIMAPVHPPSIFLRQIGYPLSITRCSELHHTYPALDVLRNIPCSD